MQEVEKVFVQHEKVLDYTKKLLMHYGLREGDANTVAANLLFANLRGLDTHGVMRLPTYLKRLELSSMVIMALVLWLANWPWRWLLKRPAKIPLV